MPDKEKCFCHLGGYKVKDADAREQITELNEKIFEHNAHLSSLDIDILSHNERITALESSGGGKLYFHQLAMSAYRGDFNNMVDLRFKFYSYSPTPLTLATVFVNRPIFEKGLDPWESYVNVEGTRCIAKSVLITASKITITYYTDLENNTIRQLNLNSSEFNGSLDGGISSVYDNVTEV